MITLFRWIRFKFCRHQWRLYAMEGNFLSWRFGHRVGYLRCDKCDGWMTFDCVGRKHG